MKFRVTFKDPDCLVDCVQDTVLENLKSENTLDQKEKDLIFEKRTTDLMNFAGKWLDYGEYVTLEFDTEANTCVVVKMDG